MQLVFPNLFKFLQEKKSIFNFILSKKMTPKICVIKGGNINLINKLQSELESKKINKSNCK